MRNIHVVFVHGIGSTRRGDSLHAWGSALSKQLAKLRPQRTPKLIAADPGLAYDCPWADYRFGDALKVRMMEAWWEGLLRPPSFFKLIGWSLRALPLTMVAHLDARLKRVSHEAIEHPSLSAGVLFVLELIPLFTGLMLIPLVVVLLVLLPFLRLVRQLRGVVGTVEAALAKSAGDSLVFSSDPLQQMTIVEKVRADIARACQSDADACIVIAHSQGAAVAHRAIRLLQDAYNYCYPGAPAPPAVLITFGSGIRKLNLLDHRRAGVTVSVDPGSTNGQAKTRAMLTACPWGSAVTVAFRKALAAAIRNIPAAFRLGKRGLGAGSKRTNRVFGLRHHQAGSEGRGVAARVLCNLSRGPATADGVRVGAEPLLGQTQFDCAGILGQLVRMDGDRSHELAWTRPLRRRPAG